MAGAAGSAYLSLTRLALLPRREQHSSGPAQLIALGPCARRPRYDGSHRVSVAVFGDGAQHQPGGVGERGFSTSLRR